MMRHFKKIAAAGLVATIPILIGAERGQQSALPDIRVANGRVTEILIMQRTGVVQIKMTTTDARPQNLSFDFCAGGTAALTQPLLELLEKAAIAGKTVAMTYDHNSPHLCVMGSGVTF